MVFCHIKLWRQEQTLARTTFQSRRALGVKFFIADVIDESNLEQLATLSVDLPLSTGADLLPVMLARNWQRDKKSQPKTLLPPAPGYEAVISGSCTGKSVRQLAHFEQTHPVFRIDLLEASQDANMVDRIVEWAKDRLEKGPVGVGTSTDPEGVKRSQAELGREGAATLADKLLSSVAQHFYQHGVRKFVVMGGETSGAVMASLGIEQVSVGDIRRSQRWLLSPCRARSIVVGTESGRCW